MQSMTGGQRKEKKSKQLYIQNTYYIHTYVHISDEFEVEDSSSSPAKLWRFQAEPSQAGALQFLSWNGADNTDNMYINFQILLL